MNTSRLGTSVAAVLLLDALAHLFWLVRPAADPRALSVAAASRGRGGRPARAVTLAVGAGTLVRGELGLAWAFGLGTDAGVPFHRLNLLLYTPLCLAMAVAVGIVLARSGSRSSGILSTVAS